MKRFKKPKVAKEKPILVPTDYIMKVIMPCVMLGCKDEFKIKDQSRLEKLGKRIQQNINFISNDIVTPEQLRELMEINDSIEATTYFESITVIKRREQNEEPKK